MSLFVDLKKEYCVGCGACAQICPQRCISMHEDEEGFLYPIIDRDFCIECGRCKKVCPVEAVMDARCKEEVYEFPKAYGGFHIDENIRLDSSSGGAFTLLAEYVFEKQGVVYGCCLNNDQKAVHIGIEKVNELPKLRKSKYVQSDIGYVYQEVESKLLTDRYIMFVGTPCQVAGLKNYLGKVYEKLILVDFICHGVPSQKVFTEYIKNLEYHKNSKIVGFEFRTKDKGWDQSGLQLGTKAIYENDHNERRYPAFQDSYMNIFLSDVALRPSCYSCAFKSIPKYYSDFTIADFWGVNSIDESLNDGKGTSLVLVHNEKAKSIWEKCQDRFCGHEVNYPECITKNPTLIKSANRNFARDKFYSVFREKGYGNIKKKYGSAMFWFLSKLGNYTKKIFEQFIKFCCVGVMNTLISLLVYYGLLYGGTDYRFAYTLGFIASTCNAYFWNKKFIFVNKKDNSAKRTFLKVFISYLSSYLLSLVLVTFLVECVHVPEWMAPIVKIVIIMPFNFLLNKFWVFREGKIY